MAENLSPGEKRAEAYRQRVRRLGQAMTTEELIEAADAVSRAAKLTIKADERLVKQIKEETKEKDQQG